MKFYSKRKKQVAWDTEKNRRLCTFRDGEFETDDPRIIKILTTKHDFETDGAVSVVPELPELPEEETPATDKPKEKVALIDMLKAELLKLAGDKGKRTMTKTQLIEVIEG